MTIMRIIMHCIYWIGPIIAWFIEMFYMVMLTSFRIYSCWIRGWFVLHKAIKSIFLRHITEVWKHWNNLSTFTTCSTLFSSCFCRCPFGSRCYGFDVPKDLGFCVYLNTLVFIKTLYNKDCYNETGLSYVSLNLSWTICHVYEYINSFIPPSVLVHLSWKLKGAFLITCCPLSTTFTFSSSSLEGLDQFEPKLLQSILGWWEFKFVWKKGQAPSQWGKWQKYRTCTHLKISRTTANFNQT